MLFVSAALLGVNHPRLLGILTHRQDRRGFNLLSVSALFKADVFVEHLVGFSILILVGTG